MFIDILLVIFFLFFYYSFIRRGTIYDILFLILVFSFNILFSPSYSSDFLSLMHVIARVSIPTLFLLLLTAELDDRIIEKKLNFHFIVVFIFLFVLWVFLV
jgi:hypothetical protein